MWAPYPRQLRPEHRHHAHHWWLTAPRIRCAHRCPCLPSHALHNGGLPPRAFAVPAGVHVCVYVQLCTEHCHLHHGGQCPGRRPRQACAAADQVGALRLHTHVQPASRALPGASPCVPGARQLLAQQLPIGCRAAGWRWAWSWQAPCCWRRPSLPPAARWPPFSRATLRCSSCWHSFCPWWRSASWVRGSWAGGLRPLHLRPAPAGLLPDTAPPPTRPWWKGHNDGHCRRLVHLPGCCMCTLLLA